MNNQPFAKDRVIHPRYKTDKQRLLLKPNTMNFFKSLTLVYRDIIILGLLLLGFVSAVLLTVYLISTYYYL